MTPNPAASRLHNLANALCESPDLTAQGADLMVRLDAAAFALVRPELRPAPTTYPGPTEREWEKGWIDAVANGQF